jgi:hypothetical protein
VIADDLVYVRIQTVGGLQVMPTLLLRAVPYWLATIDTRRMDRGDERRAEILEYQRNAVDALYRWAQSLRREGRAALIESEPIEKPATPDKDADLQEWQHYYEQMAAFTAWRISLEEWRGTVENRLENLEAVVPLILEQLPPATITPTHQNVVKYYVSEYTTAEKRFEMKSGLRSAFFPEAVKSPLHHIKVDKQPSFLVTPIKVIQYGSR